MFLLQYVLLNEKSPEILIKITHILVLESQYYATSTVFWALFICQNNNKLTRSFNINLLNLRLQKSYPFILTRIQLHTSIKIVFYSIL